MTNRKQAVFGRLVCGIVAVLTALMLLPVRGIAAAEGDVAQIINSEGEILKGPFETVDEAIDAAEDGDTIELLADATLSKDLGNKGTITIDGQNHSLTSTNRRYGFFDGDNIIFKNVTVNFNYNIEVENPTFSSDLGLFYVNGETNFTFENSTVNFVNTGATNRLHGIYYDSCGGSIKVLDSTLNITGFPEDAIEWGGKSNSYIYFSNSTYVSSKNRAGITGTWNITVDNSRVEVLDSIGNGSNGSNYYLNNSALKYNNNGSHGLSAGDLLVYNSTIESDGNGYYGIYVNGDFFVDSTSVINVKHNSHKGDFAGFKIYTGVTNGIVKSGATINILDNYCSGLSNNVVVTFEENANLTVMNNVNNDSGCGGGIYNTGSAKLVLPGNAVVYNNHATVAGDDIYNNTDATISFCPVGTDWTLDGCDDRIDGWYDDAAGSRWNAHAEKAEDNHIVLYPNTELGESYTITSLKALKAAHDNVPDVEPALDKTSNGADAIGQVTTGSVIPFEVSISVPTVGGNLTVTDQMSNMTFNNDLTLNNRTVEYTALDSSFSLTIPEAYRGQTVVLRYSGTVVSSAKAGDTVSNTAYFDGNHDTVLGTVKADEGIGHNDPYLKVNKLWTGDDDSAVRPSSIQVNVYHEEDLYKTITIYERYKWM